MSKLFLGADHAGFAEKERAKPWLEHEGYTVVDCGASSLEQDDDYPPYARAVAEHVAAGEGRGILFCGSGEGMAIVANRLPGVRAAVCWNANVARESRNDNDANILSIGTRFTTPDDIEAIIESWLDTSFSEQPRHVRRIAAIDRS